VQPNGEGQNLENLSVVQGGGAVSRLLGVGGKVKQKKGKRRGVGEPETTRRDLVNPTGFLRRTREQGWDFGGEKDVPTFRQDISAIRKQELTRNKPIRCRAYRNG